MFAIVLLLFNVIWNNFGIIVGGAVMSMLVVVLAIDVVVIVNCG